MDYVLEIYWDGSAALRPNGEVWRGRRGIAIPGPFVRYTERSDERAFLGIHHADFWGVDRYTPSVIKDLWGFDFIRVSIEPAIILRSPPGSALRTSLWAQVREGLTYYISAGLKVQLSFQFWAQDTLWDNEIVMSAGWPNFRGAVRELTMLALEYPQGSIVIEPLNEPNWSKEDDVNIGWLQKQRTILSDIRELSPILPVMVSGVEGQVEGILALNDTNIDMMDRFLVYSFHFYEPFYFTHQDSLASGFKVVTSVPWPASNSTKAAVVAAAQAEVDASDLGAEEKISIKNDIFVQMDSYYKKMYDENVVQARFDQIAAWATANSISPETIVVGEFAALDWRGSPSASFKNCRIAWDRAVRSSAEEHNFAWCFWTSPLTEDIPETLVMR